MREILFTILLWGCLALTSAQNRPFEFRDSYGRCWRCSPGSSCVKCPTDHYPWDRNPSPSWDRTCPEPDRDICEGNLGKKFPSLDIGFYWICGEDGEIAIVPCFCDHVFDMSQQECVLTENLESIGCENYLHGDPHDCADTGERPPPNLGVTTTTPPTVPNDEETTTESKTTTEYTTTTTVTPTVTQPGGTTRTTEVGGPGASPLPGNTTTVATPTTPPPCVCVVWWPCWCNPCWNMPCHSCHGCVGMG